jgi:hypothetical protein
VVRAAFRYLLGSALSSSGHDIRFTTEAGVTLVHETESYHGNAAASSDPSVTTVWSSAYSAVWHLGEAGAGWGRCRRWCWRWCLGD